MKGLRTKEDKKFIKFFDLVQKKAREVNSVFFLDSGECKDIEFEDLIIDEISGWLIPINISDEFEKEFVSKGNLDRFEKWYTWCIPAIENENLIIEFKNF